MGKASRSPWKTGIRRFMEPQRLQCSFGSPLERQERLWKELWGGKAAQDSPKKQWGEGGFGETPTKGNETPKISPAEPKKSELLEQGSRKTKGKQSQSSQQWGN